MNYLAFEAWISFCALLAIYRWWFVPLWVDNFRADIREIRDGLFDFMWQNGCDFDEAAYVEVRQMLNGLLRSARHVSLISFLWHAWHFDEYNFPASARSQLPSGPLKEAIYKAVRDASRRLLHLIFLEGITGIWLRIALDVLSAVRYVQCIKIWAARRVQAILLEAYILGRPQLSPTERLMLG